MNVMGGWLPLLIALKSNASSFTHNWYPPLFSISDFCYGNEDLTFSISEAIKLCVTVVAYAPESFRR